MYRGTTPTIVFNVNFDIDFSLVKQVWATFKSQTVEITKDLEQVELDNDNKTVSVKLSQTETLQFSNQHVETQLRFLLDDGTAYATNIVKLPMNAVLKGGVISEPKQNT